MAIHFNNKEKKPKTKQHEKEVNHQHIMMINHDVIQHYSLGHHDKQMNEYMEEKITTKMAVKNVNKIMIGLNKNNNKTMKQHFTHTHTHTNMI